MGKRKKTTKRREPQAPLLPVGSFGAGGGDADDPGSVGEDVCVHDAGGAGSSGGAVRADSDARVASGAGDMDCAPARGVAFRGELRGGHDRGKWRLAENLMAAVLRDIPPPHS